MVLYGQRSSEDDVAMRFRRPVLLGAEWLLMRRDGAKRSGLANVFTTFEADNDGPLSVDGHIGLALALLRKIARHPYGRGCGRLIIDRAVRHLRWGIEEMPKDPVLWRALGTAQLLAQEFDEGIEALEVCQTLVPRVAPEVELDLLRLCLDHGAERDGRERYEQLNLTLPDTDRRAACLAAFDRGAGRWMPACEALSEARRRWPASLVVHVEWAETLWAGGEVQAAVRELAAMKIDHPGVACVEWNYIAALALAGEPLAAQCELDRASADVAADMGLMALIARTQSPTSVSMPASVALAGDLATMSIPDVMNLLWQSRASGLLSVEAGFGPCALQFYAGDLLGAVLPEDSNDASEKGPASEEVGRPTSTAGAAATRSGVHQKILRALALMLPLQRGRFTFDRFSEEDAPDERESPVLLPTPDVLMEACAALDASPGQHA